MWVLYWSRLRAPCTLKCTFASFTMHIAHCIIPVCMPLCVCVSVCSGAHAQNAIYSLSSSTSQLARIEQQTRVDSRVCVVLCVHAVHKKRMYRAVRAAHTAYNTYRDARSLCVYIVLGWSIQLCAIYSRLCKRMRARTRTLYKCI